MCDEGHVLGTVTHHDQPATATSGMWPRGHQVLRISRKARNLDFSCRSLCF